MPLHTHVSEGDLPGMSPEHRRLWAFLDALRAVYESRACLTPPGADYLGTPYRFPTLAERAPTEDDPPADVRPLRGKVLQEAAGALRQIRNKRSH